MKKLFGILAMAFLLTSCFSSKEDLTAEYSKLEQEHRKNFDQLKEMSSGLETRKFPSMTDAENLYFRITSNNDALKKFLEKASKWDRKSEAEEHLRLGLSAQERVESLIKLLERMKKSASVDASEKKSSSITHKELHKLANVGMKIGQKYWVTSEYSSRGNSLIDPAGRDSSGRYVGNFLLLMVSDEMLNSEQKSALYDMRGSVGCFQVIMASGQLEILDLKKGACE